MVVLWNLSDAPGDTLTPSLPGPSGNLLHIVAYGVLGGLLLRATVPFADLGWSDPASWPGWRDRRGRLVLGLVTLAGCADEIHQFYVPGRVCSVLDLVADGLGTLAVLTWPGSGPGRPTGRAAVAAVLGAAVAVALWGWLDRPFPDRLLEDLLIRLEG